VPELPEVETIVRSLRPRLTGLRIEGLKALLPSLIREKERPRFEGLAGARITGLRRRGKMILIDCSGGRSLLFHLKMTGRLLLCPKNTPPDKHTHLIISFRRTSRDLRFRDVRKFGFVCLIETGRAAEAPEVSRLGPEPFDLDATGFRHLLAGRRGRIKPLLLNQNLIAGIGNIYADEILFASGIHPQSTIENLSRRRLLRLGEMVPLILERPSGSREQPSATTGTGRDWKAPFRTISASTAARACPVPAAAGRSAASASPAGAVFSVPAASGGNKPARLFDRGELLV